MVVFGGIEEHSGDAMLFEISFEVAVRGVLGDP